MCQKSVVRYTSLTHSKSAALGLGEVSMKEKALNMEKICIGFNGIPVLKDIDFSLDKGEVCGLVGKNGAGSKREWVW